MKKRCLNPKARYYYNYGGRGITVCERWLNDFKAFLADVGRRPSNQHSLDRYPDTNGHYEKANCRWATRSEQNENTNAVRFRDLNDHRISVAAMARHLALPVDALRYQFERLGLSPDHGAVRVRARRNASKAWLPLRH